MGDELRVGVASNKRRGSIPADARPSCQRRHARGALCGGCPPLRQPHAALSGWPRPVTSPKNGSSRSLWATEPGTPDAPLAAEPLASDLAIAGACVVCARLRKQRKSRYTSEWRGRLPVDHKYCLRLASNAARGSHPRSALQILPRPPEPHSSLLTPHN